MPGANVNALVALRSDLQRVSRTTHGVAGVAPRYIDYRELGRYSDVRIRGAVRGYDPESRCPRASWSEAMEAFGLRLWDRCYRATPQVLQDDLYRVAVMSGWPMLMPAISYYREHGEWNVSTVLKHLGPTWGAAAAAVGLEARERGAWQHQAPASREKRSSAA